MDACHHSYTIVLCDSAEMMYSFGPELIKYGSNIYAKINILITDYKYDGGIIK